MASKPKSDKTTKLVIEILIVSAVVMGFFIRSAFNSKPVPQPSPPANRLPSVVAATPLASSFPGATGSPAQPPVGSVVQGTADYETVVAGAAILDETSKPLTPEQHVKIAQIIQGKDNRIQHADQVQMAIAAQLTDAQKQYLKKRFEDQLKSNNGVFKHAPKSRRDAFIAFLSGQKQGRVRVTYTLPSYASGTKPVPFCDLLVSYYVDMEGEESVKLTPEQLQKLQGPLEAYPAGGGTVEELIASELTPEQRAIVDEEMAKRKRKGVHKENEAALIRKGGGK